MEHGKDNLNAAGNGMDFILAAYDKMIDSYDLIIEDLSREVYDPVLQAQKEPVVAYLKAMREQWRVCREDVRRQIEALNLQL